MDKGGKKMNDFPISSFATPKIPKPIGMPANNFVLVKFIKYDKKSSVLKLDSGLFVPERYVIEEADEDAQTAWGVTTDRRLINPQVIEVIQGNELWINKVKDTYPEFERDKILKENTLIPDGGQYFVHYGAMEVCRWVDDDHALIPAKLFFFGLDPIKCLPGIYLGEEVFGDLPKTASGIYLTPQMEDKVGIKVKIIHTPENAHPLVQVGSTVITVDAFQYDLNYNGKKYIKLEEGEIIGVEQNGEYIPLGNSVLVEHLPDPDLEARVAENDKRRAHRDYIDKTRMHISEQYTKGLDPEYLDLPEPKTISARILAIGEDVADKSLVVGDKLLILRNYGCILPNKQWILNLDLVLGSFK